MVCHRPARVALLPVAWLLARNIWCVGCGILTLLRKLTLLRVLLAVRDLRICALLAMLRLLLPAVSRLLLLLLHRLAAVGLALRWRCVGLASLG